MATDLKISNTNDLDFAGGLLTLLTTKEELVRQRILNKLNTFTGTLFTNINYGLNANYIFEKGTQSLVDQDIKSLVQQTSGVVSLKSFTSTVGSDRVYRTNFTYEIETGELVSIANLGVGSSGLLSRVGIWSNGVWDYYGSWDNEEIWGEGGAFNQPRLVSVYNFPNFVTNPFEPKAWVVGSGGTLDAVVENNPTLTEEIGLVTQTSSASEFVFSTTPTYNVALTRGDYFSVGFIAKEVAGFDSNVDVRVTSNIGKVYTFKVNVENPTDSGELVTTALGDGYTQFQLNYPSYEDGVTSLQAEFLLPEGSANKVKVQGLFLGDVGGDEVVGDIEYSGTNYMPSPFNPEGWSNDTDGTIVSETIGNSSGQSFMGLVEQTQVGFFRINDETTPIPVITGEKVYNCILLKKVTPDCAYRIRFGLGETFYSAVSVNLDSMSVFHTEGKPCTTRIAQLPSGDYLVEIELVMQDDSTGVTCRAYMVDGVQPVTGAPVGSKFYAQAAYFGKTGKFQGSVTYPDSVNLMPSPFDPSGWSGATIEPDLSYTSVTESNPSGESFVGEFEQAGAGFGIFASSSGIPVVVGDKVFLSIIIKAGTSSPSVQVRLADSQGFLEAGRYSSVDGSYISGSNYSRKVDDLGAGWILLQCEYVATRDDSNLVGNFWIIDSSGSGVPAVGASLFSQAVYFGKSDTWPALVTPPEENQYPAIYTPTVINSTPESLIVSEQ